MWGWSITAPSCPHQSGRRGLWVNLAPESPGKTSRAGKEWPSAVKPQQSNLSSQTRRLSKSGSLPCLHTNRSEFLQLLNISRALLASNNSLLQLRGASCLCGIVVQTSLHSLHSWSNLPTILRLRSQSAAGSVVALVGEIYEFGVGAGINFSHSAACTPA